MTRKHTVKRHWDPHIFFMSSRKTTPDFAYEERPHEEGSLLSIVTFRRSRCDVPCQGTLSEVCRLFPNKKKLTPTEAQPPRFSHATDGGASVSNIFSTKTRQSVLETCRIRLITNQTTSAYSEHTTNVCSAQLAMERRIRKMIIYIKDAVLIVSAFRLFFY